MHRVGSVPWSIRADTLKELIFLGYIGAREGFHVPDVAAPATSIEAEWQAWWQHLLTHNFTTITAEVWRDNPDPTDFSSLREIARRHQATYDPPSFTVLADRPALQALCQRYWPDYHREWETIGGSKLSFVDKVYQRINRLHLQALVQKCVKASGKRLVPFTLSFDFLYWPEDYVQHVSETYVVLGRRYLDDAGALRQIMRAAIIEALG